MPSRNNPIAAVQKKNAASTTRKKRTVSSSKSPRASKKVQEKYGRAMPIWLRNILTVMIVGCFSAVFYYFFIRPYAYRWKPCNGLKEYGVCIPSGYDIHGIDISHYQGKIDWERLQRNQQAATPLHFVFMKATDFFIRTVKLDTGDLPPVLDVEVTGRKEKQELQQGLKRWLDRVESHYGVKPILYTSYKFKTRYLDDSIFNAYPYWIAHYYVDSVKYQGKWNFWQHTDVGNVPGIKEDVDLNVFNGTLEDLKKLTIK